LSPDEIIELNVAVSTDKISYSISKDNIEIISQSGLDIALTTGNLAKGLTLEDYHIDETNEILTLPCGEKNEIPNNYMELILNLKNASNLKFELIFRIYNQGVGFRYHFPENNALSDIRLSNEYTQFIMWYGRPANYQVPLEIELFSFLPVTWDYTRLAAGEMGEFVSYARKKK
jgi:alpha-glucosidase